ncbi:DNA-methyltransferase [Actinomadura sp. 6N118]|uniref:DNA-methyltransferase n=1 Tax=Actinomadura sp. 6N118 TaxID=3375151 RepID=UPI0037B272EF
MLTGCWLTPHRLRVLSGPANRRQSPARKARYGTFRPPQAGDRAGLRGKNLLGVPWRVAFALQADGWYLRNAVVWNKPNAMPESVTDRLSSRYELIFLLSQQPRYYFDLDAIRAPLTGPGSMDADRGTGDADKAGQRMNGDSSAQGARRRDDPGYGPSPEMRPNPRALSRRRRRDGCASKPNSISTGYDPYTAKGRNPGDVWSVPTRPFPGAHFAVFPIDIPLRAIAAGCPPGGVVLDPFSGAGTTARAAQQLQRSYVGVDLRADYHLLALRRLGLLPDRPDSASRL